MLRNSSINKLAKLFANGADRWKDFEFLREELTKAIKKEIVILGLAKSEEDLKRFGELAANEWLEVGSAEIAEGETRNNSAFKILTKHYDILFIPYRKWQVADDVKAQLLDYDEFLEKSDIVRRPEFWTNIYNNIQEHRRETEALDKAQETLGEIEQTEAELQKHKAIEQERKEGIASGKITELRGWKSKNNKF